MNPTRFVLLDANHPAPSLANGGIVELPRGWWPVRALPDGTQREFFRTLEERVTMAPPGADNPEGLIAGAAVDPADLVEREDKEPPANGLPAGLRIAKAPPNNPRACGLLIRGHADSFFSNDLVRLEKDQREVLGRAGQPDRQSQPR